MLSNIKQNLTTFIPLCPEDKCTKCDLHKQANHVGMSTVKYSFVEENDLVLLVLNQNPDFHEDLQGLSFTGKNNKILKESFLGGLQLKERCSIYLGYGVRCHSTNNEAPKPRHYFECTQYLINDLKSIQPNIILTLGAPTTISFYKNILGISKMSLKKSFSLNGNSYDNKDHNIKGVGGFNVFSTYHPNAVLRNNNLINSVHSHMELLSDCIDGTMATPSKPKIISTRSPNVYPRSS